MLKSVKRSFMALIAITLAMILVLAFPSIASAEEIADNSTSNTTGIILISDTGIIESPFVNKDGSIEFIVSGSNSANNAYSQNGSELVNQSYTNQRIGDKQTVKRNMPYEGYLCLEFSVSGSAKIKLTMRDGIFWSTLVNDTVTNDTLHARTNATMNAGWGIEVTMEAVQNDSSYRLKMWVE